MSEFISGMYLVGINEGRALLKLDPALDIQGHLETLRALRKQNKAGTATGESVRGEIDFFESVLALRVQH